MRLWLLLPLFMCAGCAVDPFEASTLEDLRVVALVAEPPYAEPGGLLRLTTWVADPAGRGADVLVWTCQNVGDGCLEATGDAGQQPLVEWTSVGTGIELAYEATPVLLPLELAELPEPGTDDRALIWTLACAPGLCPIIDRVRANPAPGSAAYAETVRLLAAPDELVAGVPSDQVSVAFRTLRLSRPNRNPCMSAQTVPTCGVLPMEVGPPAQRVDDPPVVDADGDQLRVQAWTTLGTVRAEIVDGVVDVQWSAPHRVQRAGRIFTVVDDTRGGVAVHWQDVLATW